tara:strand:- start:608 stop:784 length:177 start_codon:yes stop_codon:yes gene_type:complete
MAKTLLSMGKKSPTVNDLTKDQRKLYNRFLSIGASKQTSMIEAMGTNDPLNHKIFKLR